MHSVFQSNAVLILVAGALLSLPSFLNGLPFLFSDSTFYINHGHVGIGYWSFLWRPMTYSLVVGYISRAIGILPFIFLQNLFVAWTLFLLVSTLTRRSVSRTYLAAVALLYLTPLPLYSNFILPDVFAGLIPVFLFILLIQRVRWSSTIALVFSIMSHFSNILTATFFPLLFWKSRKLKWMFLFLMSAWILLPSLHYFSMGNFTVSNVANTIIFSRFAHVGLHNKILDEECGKGAPLLMCKNRHLPFELWGNNPEGMVAQLGGLHNLAYDMGHITRKGLTTPRYLSEFLLLSLDNVLRQATAVFDRTLPIFESELIEREVQWTQVISLEEFKGKSRLRNFFHDLSGPLSTLHGLAFLLALIYLGRVLILNSGPKKYRIFFFLLLGVYLINAFFCGLLTDPSPRYGARISWMFFFLASIHFIQYPRAIKKLVMVETMPFDKALASVLFNFIVLAMFAWGLINSLTSLSTNLFFAIVVAMIFLPALPTWSDLKSKMWFPFLLIFVFSFLVRAWNLDSASLRFIEHIQLWSANDVGLSAAATHGQLPLSYLFSQWGFSIFGQSPWAARFFPILWGSLSGALFFVCADRFLKRKTVLFGTTLLFILSPWLIYYSKVGIAVSLSILSATLYTLIFFRIMENRSNSKSDLSLLFVSSLILAYSSLPLGVLYIVASNLATLLIAKKSAAGTKELFRPQLLAIFLVLPDIFQAMIKSSAIFHHFQNGLVERVFRGSLLYASNSGALFFSCLTLLVILFFSNARKLSSGLLDGLARGLIPLAVVLASSAIYEFSPHSVMDFGLLLILVPVLILCLGGVADELIEKNASARMRYTLYVMAVLLAVGGYGGFRSSLNNPESNLRQWRAVYETINKKAQKGDLVLVFDLKTEKNWALNSVVAGEMYLDPDLQLVFPTHWSDRYVNLFTLDLFDRPGFQPQNIFVIHYSIDEYDLNQIADNSEFMTIENFGLSTHEVKEHWSDTVMTITEQFLLVVPRGASAMLHLKQAEIELGLGNYQNANTALDQMQNVGIPQSIKQSYYRVLRRKIREQSH